MKKPSEAIKELFIKLSKERRLRDEGVLLTDIDFDALMQYLDEVIPLLEQRILQLEAKKK